MFFDILFSYQSNLVCYNARKQKSRMAYGTADEIVNSTCNVYVDVSVLAANKKAVRLMAQLIKLYQLYICKMWTQLNWSLNLNSKSTQSQLKLQPHQIKVNSNFNHILFKYRKRVKVYMLTFVHNADANNTDNNNRAQKSDW